MQNMSAVFSSKVSGGPISGRCSSLEPARMLLESYFSKAPVPASVFIMERDEDYPVIVITPRSTSDMDAIKTYLTKDNIRTKMFPGVGLEDLLCVIEKQGNKHWGIALKCSFDLVNCVARSLTSVKAPAPVLEAN